MGKIIRCQSTTTYSSMVGGVTSYIESFIKAKFPKNFFNDVIISDTNTNILLNNKDVVSYQPPYLIIKPEITLDENFLETTPSWYDNRHYIPGERYRRNSLFKILKDEEHSIYLYTLPTRVRLSFQLMIKVPTSMYMYNTIQYFNNLFEKNSYEYINNVRLQTIIPKIIMMNLANFNGFNLEKEEEQELFIDYLNKNAFNGGIEENINLASGNTDFYFTYQTNILNNYPDRVQYDKNVKNLTVDDCNLTFNFFSELWIPNRYLLEIPENLGSITNYDEDDNKSFIYNMVIDTSYILPKIEDKHLILKKKFLPEVNVEYDALNFEMILTNELKKVLDILKKEEALNTNIFEVLLMCGNKALNKEEFNVDYENYIIYTKNPMKNTAYTVLIYGNLEILNKVSEKS